MFLKLRLSMPYMLVLLVCQLFISVNAQGLFNKTSDNIAISGYDTVAYFTTGKATLGLDEYQADYSGVTWFFSSLEHKELFIADPERYAPQFAGHCANGLSDGHLVQANPEIFRIIDNRLYLFFSRWGRTQWQFDQQGQIALAEHYWQEFSKPSD